MGATISSIILPIVTFEWSDLEFTPFYYDYIEPLVSFLPSLESFTPRRIIAINWSRLWSNMYNMTFQILSWVPTIFSTIWDILVKIFKFCQRLSFYPIIILGPIILSYYVFLSMSQGGVISPRRLKESSQRHFLATERSFSAHPLRVYADETASI